jgi:hypothetical protein
MKIPHPERQSPQERVTTQVLSKTYETLKTNHEGDSATSTDLEISPIGCLGAGRTRPASSRGRPRDEVAGEIKHADLLVVDSDLLGNMTGVMKNLSTAASGLRVHRPSL